MATITLQGKPMHTVGELPNVGDKAPDFELVNTDLSTTKLSDYKGKKVVLNIFPSIDTGVCATSVKKFNEQASGFANTKVVCVSKDLPFAHSRFCGAEGLDHVVQHSDFRDGNFGKDYGLEITEGPMKGLHARAVVVLDENGVVLHKEQVSELSNEPDYASAMVHLS